jgi:hypothetical protein
MKDKDAKLLEEAYDQIGKQNPHLMTSTGDNDKLTDDDILTMTNKSLKVNGKPFVVEFPNEPLWDVQDNKLVTLFRGHLYNYWKPSEIEGYYA